MQIQRFFAILYHLVSINTLSSALKLYRTKLLWRNQDESTRRYYCRINKSSILMLAAKPEGNIEEDWITKVFKPFLPTPESIGLNRISSIKTPECFPCVKDRIAEPIASDKSDPDKVLIRPLLAGTNLESRDLVCIYDANKDGWSASKFHNKLDKKGPAIVLCRDEKQSAVFGGYNPTGWVNYGEYRGSIAAFLFTNILPDGPISGFTKLAKISGAGLAQIDDGSGPKFGMEGLTIPLSPSGSKKARSKLGLYYENLPKNAGRSIFPGGVMEVNLAQCRVFVGVYAPGEKIPYDDAIPFAIN